ncbi:Relaxin receptor 1-like Protein [Tribolium castaneum]|uniref:Relaxin receptor 1-like Protein n=1 Tax=Tribolium castaneum TaxID=7070 RepID=D6WY07_TRICA|nr:Relaxin receptor 1-like Protein [Tribolium castaneum]
MFFTRLIILTLISPSWGCDYNGMIYYDLLPPVFGDYLVEFSVKTYSETQMVEILSEIPVLCTRQFNFSHPVDLLLIADCGVEKIEAEFLLNTKYQPDSLSVTGNSIRTIRRHTFRNLATMFYTLRDNLIESIENEAFANLSNAKFVDLAENRITVFECNCFVNVPNLIQLILEDNKINSLKAKCFKFLQNNGAVLVLRYNEISKIDPQVFDEMPAQNVSIHLEFNAFENLPVRILRKHAFVVFNLTGNQIRHLQFEIVENFSVGFLTVDANLDPNLVQDLKFFAKVVLYNRAQKMSPNTVFYLIFLTFCIFY